MTSENASNTLQLAKQGDPKAIASLINRQLQPKGITAKASLKDGFLQIMLESASVPKQQVMVTGIRKWIDNNLSTASIQKVKLYGKQTGEEFPDWHEEFEVSRKVMSTFDNLGKDVATTINSSISQIALSLITQSEAEAEVNTLEDNSTEENVTAYDVFYYPLQVQIEMIEAENDIDEFDSWLNPREPNEIALCIAQGIEDLIDYCEEFISERTIKAINQQFVKIKALCDQKQLVWAKLKEYEAGNNYVTVGRQVFSDEAKLGAVIGSYIFPGVGTVIGAFLGAMSNAREIDEEKELYLKTFGDFFEELGDIYDDMWEKIICPLLSEDLETYSDE